MKRFKETKYMYPVCKVQISGRYAFVDKFTIPKGSLVFITGKTDKKVRLRFLGYPQCGAWYPKSVLGNLEEVNEED